MRCGMLAAENLDFSFISNFPNREVGEGRHDFVVVRSIIGHVEPPFLDRLSVRPRMEIN
jgi:hypothetical protein